MIKEGSFGTVAIDGGYLEISYNEKIIKKVKVPAPNYQAEKNRDSVVENDDGFSDEYKNEYSVYVYSSRYGIDYTIELIHSEDELKATITFDLTIKTESGKEYKSNLSFDMPVEGVVENGTAAKEITDLSNIIFKRTKN